ncbi:plasmid pRiA4b ORF-3 family protein [Desulfomonile tiedjei]|nr:plasmid pRiA4b ORF-3 family protein [Desulfomonile tiedjei]
MKKKSVEKRIYQLKITLRGIRPPIWRRIQVRSDTSLYLLHHILQTVMGWDRAHLHEFFVFGDSYGDSKFMEGEVLEEKNVTLGQLITGEKERFRYLYDFGDSWEHEIVVEKILPMESEIRYPVCIKGKRACPPEDCGGAPGYENLLEVLKDPSDPEYEDVLDWVSSDFDPEEFNLELINKILART